MSFRASIDALHADLGALAVALDALRRRAADTPPDDELQLSQELADAGDTMAGWANEACDTRDGTDRDPAHLVRAHQLTLQIADQLDDSTSHARIADIVAVGQEGGSAWRDWAIDVQDALDACREALTGVEHRVLAAWREFAEANVAHAVSVSALNVGPHVSLGDRDPITTGGQAGAADS
jgi:hypothetical protein